MTRIALLRTAALCLPFVALNLAAQDAAPPVPSQPGGTVLFSRDSSAGTDKQPTEPSAPQPPSTPAEFAPPPAASGMIAPGDPDPLQVTEAERSALTFTAYDLDLHLAPAAAGLSARAILGVRNDGAAPLTRLVLQLSSSLHWDSISLRPDPSTSPVAAHFVSRIVDTDADHTGAMSEAVVSLPTPLAPGATLSVIALYSGTISQSAQRLVRIGAPSTQALAQDWDTIAVADPAARSQVGTALRGFGNVLWYPVSAPPAFLGDGARLFDLVGRTKLRESPATLRLRLAIEYAGEPPDAAYLNGRRGQLSAISDDPNLPVDQSRGVATTLFDTRPIGFRVPNLFVTGAAAHLTDKDLVAAVTGQEASIPAYAAAAAQITPMLANWLGLQPNGPLTVLDHPGDPFEDDALLVHSMTAPVSSSNPAAAPPPPDLTPALVHSLTHAWTRSSHPWIDEGLPMFFSLLWTERTQGPAAALAQLAELDRPLALAEPDFSDPSHAPSPAGASLDDASGEVFYRNKAAAVWWMLRAIAGDDALKQALQDYRKDPRLDRDNHGFEQALEAAAHMDLVWFFRDWVYADKGLPDLRIANVAPSPLASNSATSTGWLVAVEVHNDGYAEAQVPVIVRSADATETRQLRVPGRASASVRIVFTGRPTQLQVNDGTVPETEASVHTRELVMPAH